MILSFVTLFNMYIAQDFLTTTLPNIKFFTIVFYSLYTILQVKNNVCYLTHGHGYFLEDSVEQRTIIDGNLGLGTQHGLFLMSDMAKDWCNETYSGFCE